MRVRLVSAAGADAAVAGAEEAADGFEDFGRVFGDDADGGAIDDDVLVADGGLDGEVLFDGQADELGEFEVDGAEAFEEADEVVGVTAADGHVGAAEGAPGGGDGAVEFFVADAAEEFGVGGGTASAESDEGAALAEDTAEVEDRAGVGENFGFVHFGFFHRAPGPKRAKFSPPVSGGLLILKELSGMKTTKAG